MTASFSPALVTALKDVKGNSGPAAVDTTVKDSAAVSDVDDSEFDVEYTMQTGPTRYAPMQPVPLTKITAKTAKPQYPTSSVVIAKKKLPIPSQQTTVTQSQTHKVSSIENTVRMGRGRHGPNSDMSCRLTFFRSRRLPCRLTIWRSSSGVGKISNLYSHDLIP